MEIWFMGWNFRYRNRIFRLKISSFSQTTGMIVGITGLAVAFACNAIYWAKDPDPY